MIKSTKAPPAGAADHTIPLNDRGAGEPASCGLPPLRYAEAIAERYAPEVLKAYRTEITAFPGWAWKLKQLDGAFAELPVAQRERQIYDPMWRLMKDDLAAGKAICFGYEVESKRRILIVSAHLLTFGPGGDATALDGSRYADLRIYQMDEAKPQTDAAAGAPPKRKGGRPRIDDSVEIEKARQLVDAGKTRHGASMAVAKTRYPTPGELDKRKVYARRLRDKLRSEPVAEN